MEGTLVVGASSSGPVVDSSSAHHGSSEPRSKGRGHRSSGKKLSSSRFTWRTIAAAAAKPPPQNDLDIQYIVVFDEPTLQELSAFVSAAERFVQAAAAKLASAASDLRQALPQPPGAEGGAGEDSLAFVDVLQGTAPSPAGAVTSQHSPSAGFLAARGTRGAVARSQRAAEEQAKAVSEPLRAADSWRSVDTLEGLLCAAELGGQVHARLQGDMTKTPSEFLIPLDKASMSVRTCLVAAGRCSRAVFLRQVCRRPASLCDLTNDTMRFPSQRHRQAVISGTKSEIDQYMNTWDRVLPDAPTLSRLGQAAVSGISAWLADASAVTGVSPGTLQQVTDAALGSDKTHVTLKQALRLVKEQAAAIAWLLSAQLACVVAGESQNRTAVRVRNLQSKLRDEIQQRQQYRTFVKTRPELFEEGQQGVVLRPGAGQELLAKQAQAAPAPFHLTSTQEPSAASAMRPVSGGSGAVSGVPEPPSSFLAAVLQRSAASLPAVWEYAIQTHSQPPVPWVRHVNDHGQRFQLRRAHRPGQQPGAVGAVSATKPVPGNVRRLQADVVIWGAGGAAPSRGTPAVATLKPTSQTMRVQHSLRHRTSAAQPLPETVLSLVPGAGVSPPVSLARPVASTHEPALATSAAGIPAGASVYLPHPRFPSTQVPAIEGASEEEVRQVMGQFAIPKVAGEVLPFSSTPAAMYQVKLNGTPVPVPAYMVLLTVSARQVQAMLQSSLYVARSAEQRILAMPLASEKLGQVQRVRRDLETAVAVVESITQAVQPAGGQPSGTRPVPKPVPGVDFLGQLGPLLEFGEMPRFALLRMHKEVASNVTALRMGKPGAHSRGKLLVHLFTSTAYDTRVSGMTSALYLRHVARHVALPDGSRSSSVIFKPPPPEQRSSTDTYSIMLTPLANMPTDNAISRLSALGQHQEQHVPVAPAALPTAVQLPESAGSAAAPTFVASVPHGQPTYLQRKPHAPMALQPHRTASAASSSAAVEEDSHLASLAATAANAALATSDQASGGLRLDTEMFQNAVKAFAQQLLQAGSGSAPVAGPAAVAPKAGGAPTPTATPTGKGKRSRSTGKKKGGGDSATGGAKRPRARKTASGGSKRSRKNTAADSTPTAAAEEGAGQAAAAPAGQNKGNAQAPTARGKGKAANRKGGSNGRKRKPSAAPTVGGISPPACSTDQPPSIHAGLREAMDDAFGPVSSREEIAQAPSGGASMPPLAPPGQGVLPGSSPRQLGGLTPSGGQPGLAGAWGQHEALDTALGGGLELDMGDGHDGMQFTFNDDLGDMFSPEPDSATPHVSQPPSASTSALPNSDWLDVDL